MKLIETKLADAYVVESVLHRDDRGSFLEIYSAGAFTGLGLDVGFVQDNCSHSRDKGVIRGLHFQQDPFAQAKLVWTLTGSVYDVIVDLRKDSRTFKRWEAFILTADKPSLLFVPRGFAHGFCTLEPDTRVFYKVDAPYAPRAEGGIRWDDPDLSIPWPEENPILSDKDSRLPFLKDL
ncbi:MAG TPA: dTDP-4-dehydrorhamnose 3,5-epimerase [Deltaproteobacteria bacterium]|nr:dTDP-4-dehydrorhamnose 3,5-epimerase [Deltaproteobacteria bacterium]HPR54607.1 dTDP-4-dehydrorhamnose 3,5-epimerase [Deltaproteobacteria bacterium]HXK47261.1 dTDP-4-dehydrorhamnose 3,5-epimerase [Deltaproteobacteria bacterium]